MLGGMTASSRARISKRLVRRALDKDISLKSTSRMISYLEGTIIQFLSTGRSRVHALVFKYLLCRTMWIELSCFVGCQDKVLGG